ncbi:MAG: AAA family ATPase, partial [Oligoflexales bacterium]|nr:AAA family ATPase [Oligoflexales bacterium]
IHTVVGAGAVSGGSMDASNILKPMLSTGEIRCIGSTTYKEFRNIFENDHALARRFQKIAIEEPSISETIEILKGLKDSFETFHNVKYSADAIRGAAELSARYITDRKLPDKAIDVIDETAAAVALKNKDQKRKHISQEMIQSTISKMAKVPIQKVSIKDKSFLKLLASDIKAKVFGQDKAIDSLADAIKMSRSGLGDEDKPIGCFLFTGPTGVGKTEVARQLAEVMAVELIRFDMSEYMERHSVSRLIGAPPGYVGFDQGGLLTDAVNKTPHAVLLFDEIEKAHPDMQNILLQVMDHGTLTDNNGRKANFRNVVIVMTTNAGAQELARKTIGFERPFAGEEEKGISRAVKEMFSPEFRNRLNAIISFNSLNLDIIKMVVTKFINEINMQLKKKDVTIEATDEATVWLAQTGYDAAYGARPIKRLIEEKIKKPLADELLFGKLEKGGKVLVVLENNLLALKIL